MAQYLLYFNQQWVGDHSAEWFQSRAPLAMAVTKEMIEAGVYVFAGGLEEEDGPVFHADPTGAELAIADGHYEESDRWMGGFAIVEVPDDETAKIWAGKVAEACGWPQEVRKFKPMPPLP